MHETHPGVQVSFFACDIFLELIIVALQYSAEKVPMSPLVPPLRHDQPKNLKVLFGAHNWIGPIFLPVIFSKETVSHIKRVVYDLAT